MNGIDFFKSCSTNVRAVENVFDLQYMVFSHADFGKDLEIEHALADLRERDILCAAVQEELFIFATLEDASEVEFDLERYGLKPKDGSWLDIDLEQTNIGVDDLIETVLLDAVEGSIAYLLAKQHGIYQIGRFTWAYIGNEEADPAKKTVVIHMDANLIDNGVLYLSTKTASSRLQRLDTANYRPNTSILLAPTGQAAKVIMDVGVSGASVRVARPGSNWQSRVSKILLAEGIAVDTDKDWLFVELVDRNKHNRFAWPQNLCFVADHGSISGHDDTSSTFDWMRWFRDSQHAFKNPLAEAKEWLVGASSRERGASDNPDLAMLDETAGYRTNIVAETPLAMSSPFNQRLVDQQAALSGIYPTPPDGLIPGQLPQQHTSDGTNGTFQAEQSTLSNELQIPSSDDNPVGAGSIESNGEGPAYPMNSDDLFGDIGEMDFGATEVGDADFDYFDEPDDLPQIPSIDQDMDMAENSADFAGKDDPDDKLHEDGLDDQDAMATDESALPDSRPVSSHEQAKLQEEADQGLDEPAVAAKSSPDIPLSPQAAKEPEKPLSPWGIRRQLLPMIPASAISAEVPQVHSSRRNSTFEPMAFNDNLNLGSKYAIDTPFNIGKIHPPATSHGTSLPQDEKKKPSSMEIRRADSGAAAFESSSDSDSDESDTSMKDDQNIPPRLPWDTKKRKRSSYNEDYTPLTSATDSIWPAQDNDDAEYNYFDTDKMSEMLDNLFHDRTRPKIKMDSKVSQPRYHPALAANLPLIEDIFDLEKMDLVYVAQIVGEQAISSIPEILRSNTEPTSLDNYAAVSTALEAAIESTAEKILPAVEPCGIFKLALVKEPPPRPMMNPGKAPATGQPRPLQREGSMQLGPDYFPLAPPFLRVQRGPDTYEMLPPALSFWSALGLGPVNGAKDIAPIALVPSNPDIIGMMQDFMKDLGGIYESRKLGSFSRPSEMNKNLADISSYDDGCFLLNMDEELLSVEGALKMLAEVCDDVGQGLAGLPGHHDPDRTIVIFLIDPFEDENLTAYLAACFWKLCKAYREHVPKNQAKSPRPDLVLQIIPVSLIAAQDQLVILDSESLGSLAMEVYDRCPPSSKTVAATDTPSALPILAAPSVELAPGAPKKVVLQLTPDPPNDLMHEGSILHVAYALSTDMQWMAVTWVDTTGKYQFSTSASLSGRSFQDAASEVWDKTMDILAARDVTWRIFIASYASMDASEAKCWRKLVSSKMRRQALHATLLSIQTETSLQLTAPSLNENNNGNASGQAGAFLTPGSTPQANSMTVSPDAGGQAAPPTPAASDLAPVNAENEPGAHLLDVTDESWAMLLSPNFTSAPHDDVINEAASLARGILFRRGDASSIGTSDKLESLGVNLHWDIRIRPNGAIDEGPPKQPEATLRDVLRMYRNLGLLGRARRIGGKERGERMVPVHLAAVSRAAEALSFFRI